MRNACTEAGEWSSLSATREGLAEQGGPNTGRHKQRAPGYSHPWSDHQFPSLPSASGSKGPRLPSLILWQSFISRRIYIMLCLQPFLYLNASPPVNLVPHYRVTMEFLITVNLLNVIKSHPGMISISSLSLSHLSLHWHLHCELLFQLWNSNIYSAHTKCQC